MMEAHPVFGIGLDQFKSVEFLYNPKLAAIKPNAHIAHNTYIQSGRRRRGSHACTLSRNFGCDSSHMQESEEDAGRARRL